MNFSTDRDLLALEPTLFHDVPWVGQQRIVADDATVLGTTLSSAGADFAAAQVEAGGVVLIDRVAHEVLARVDDHTLHVSLLRARLAPVTGGETLPLAEALGRGLAGGAKRRIRRRLAEPEALAPRVH